MDTAGKSSRINDTIYQIIPDNQPPAKPGQHYMLCTVSCIKQSSFCQVALEHNLIRFFIAFLLYSNIVSKICEIKMAPKSFHGKKKNNKKTRQNMTDSCFIVLLYYAVWLVGGIIRCLLGLKIMSFSYLTVPLVSCGWGCSSQTN